MHGREGEERSKHLGNPPHMRAAPSRLGAARDSDGSLSSPASSSQSFFCKDGRKISVGDCALFKLLQDSPPSIGIICSVTVTTEKNLKLGVNWFYRPTEVNLGKGVLLEATPNEIFYSFNKNEIPATSLLHPCKVAFLPKGAELPSGISSFVCRRVYDITNRRLWWLTDKSNFNERQEEVEQLLYKTQIEMHASAQPNGRSPKQMSGSMSTSQLKPGSESLQNAASMQSQGKGKKRERADQRADPVKRERSSKVGDGESGCFSSESLLKSEIAKVVEKGPLVDTEGVDRLVQVMYTESNERKIDMSARTMLTNIIVGTEKSDCLSRFVQIRGLLILDDWLQDVHKGKTGDSSGLRDNDKVAEEFLLVLLRALDRLPVDLPALQMCNIGKSVNHLRTHKNLEIQKKARSLVDTWKKRVEAEMNMNDEKVGSNQAVSWSARSRLPEVTHVSRSTGGSSEGKSLSVQLSASKTAPAKVLQGEAAKYASQFQGSTRLGSPQSAGANMKDGQPRFGSSLNSVPLTTSREEKSCSSSPSHNSSQSCSGDHVKQGGSAVKEDPRSSAAASNKTSCSASRNRKSVNGFPASVASPRDTGPSRSSSFHKNVAPDKASQSGLTSEKTADLAPEVNSHKLIVKIPNRLRSPAQRAVGGSVDDSSAMNSRSSSPSLLERPDQLAAVKEESADAPQANASLDANGESLQESDFKDTPGEHDVGDCPVDPTPGEEHLNTDEDAQRMTAVSPSTVSSPSNTMKLVKVSEASMSPMSALIESCANHAKANAPVPIGDDVGMHLLASVAAGEMVKSEVASPADSHGTPSSVDPSCRADDPEIKLSPLDSHSRENDIPKAVGSDCTQKDRLEGSALASSEEDGKDSLLGSTEKVVGEEDKLKNCFCADVERLVVPSPGSNKVSNELAGDASDAGMDVYSEGGRHSKKEVAPEGPCLDGLQDAKANIDSSISPVNKLKDEIAGMQSETEAEVGPISGREGRNTGNNPNNCEQVEAKPSGRILSAETNARELKTADRLREAAVSEMQAVKKIKQSGIPETSKLLEVQKIAGPGSIIEKQAERESVSEKMVSGPLAKRERDLPLQDLDVREKSRRCDVQSGREGDEMKECNSSSALASIAGSLERDTRLEFDLNEGFSTDEGKCGESMNFNATISPAVTVPVVGPLTVPPSSSSASLSVPIAVSAATAKGPFVPPDDLLRAKIEIGWKGSAATSAFRPAEPRKFLEMPTNFASNTHSPDASLGKQSRPPLDFDLNVADERIPEDAAPQNSSLGMVSLDNFRSNIEKAHNEMAGAAPARGSGGLGLDLNCADEVSTVAGNFSMRSGQKADAGVRRDFDLNDEPVVDASEPSISGQQQLRSSMLAHHPPLSGLRVKGAEMGNFSTWFHAGSSYSAVPVPSILSDAGEQSFPIVAAGGPPRMTGPSASGIQFNPEMYRGPVISSSPGLPFPSAPFQYSVFPYGANFPLPSALLSSGPTTYIDPSSGGRLGFPPPVHSQLLGPAGTVTSHFPRPYMVSLSDDSGNGNIESSKKWSRQGLDLNTGPGGPELEGRDESSPLGPRQLSIGGPQNLAEEQARRYQMSSGLLKRKEPEGGWDGYRQSPWHQ